MSHDDNDQFLLAARLLGYIVHSMGGSVEFEARKIDEYVKGGLGHNLIIDTPDEERRTYRLTAK